MTPTTQPIRWSIRTSYHPNKGTAKMSAVVTLPDGGRFWTGVTFRNRGPHSLTAALEELAILIKDMASGKSPGIGNRR